LHGGTSSTKESVLLERREDLSLAVYERVGTSNPKKECEDARLAYCAQVAGRTEQEVRQRLKAVFDAIDLMRKLQADPLPGLAVYPTD
jgi:hypothetical protein